MEHQLNEITGHYTLVDGIKTYFEKIGSGKTILCLHTAGRDCRQWHPLMEYFSDKYQMVALDMPGHGKSWPLKGNVCIDEPRAYGEFIYAFIKAIELEEVVVIGCSLGGNMTLFLAQKYPDTVNAIVAMEAADFTPTISAGSLEMIMNPLINLPNYNMEFTTSLIGANAEEDAVEFLKWSVWQLTPQAQYGDLKAYSEFDMRNDMGQISCPVLLLRGEEDWIVNEKMVSETKKRLVRTEAVEFTQLKKLGHFPHVEKPNIVGELIEEFLDKYLNRI